MVTLENDFVVFDFGSFEQALVCNAPDEIVEVMGDEREWQKRGGIERREDRREDLLSSANCPSWSLMAPKVQGRRIATSFGKSTI